MDASDQFTFISEALAPRYRLERVLGSGGMAIVYLAVDERLGRKVAIKVIREDVASSIEMGLFAQEIRFLISLQHKNIVTLFDEGVVPGLELPYYVMEYIEGETLADYLAREVQLEVDETVHITRQVAAALDVAHERGIVHRDIKPANILYVNGDVWVMDFGIAKSFREPVPILETAPGQARGTVPYMSPEQVAADKRSIGPRTDVFALGAVVYEMLSGQPPHVAATEDALRRKILAAPIPPLTTVRDSVPANMDRVVRRALARTPADRFRTAGQFARALHVSRRTPRIPPAMALTAAFLTLLIVVAVVVSALNGGPDPRPKPILADPTRVAVLYFDALNNSDSASLLANGLTEDLIGHLSGFSPLYVISPDGVKPFRGREVAPDSIARQLSVASIVSGSVTMLGDIIRVRAWMIEGSTNQVLFRRTFEGRWRNLFVLQDSLTDEVGRWLRLQVGDLVRERTWLASAPSVRAWQLVKRAEQLRDAGNQRIDAGESTIARRFLFEADTLFQAAARQDDGWTTPILGRARVAWSLTFTDTGQAATAWHLRAIALADVAVGLAPTLPEARALRGELKSRAYLLALGADSLGNQARADLESALAADPRLAGARAELGLLQFRKGEFDNAASSFQRAYDDDAFLDRLPDILQYSFLGALQQNDSAAAAGWCHEALRRIPDDVRVADCEVLWLGWTGRGADAVRRVLEANRALERRTDSDRFVNRMAERRMAIAAVYARSGNAERARAYVDSARTTAAARGVFAARQWEPYILLLLGDRSGALESLNAYLSDSPHMRAYLARGPWFAAERGDPDFAALLQLLPGVEDSLQ